MSGGSRLSDLDGNVLNHHTGVSCMSQYSVVDRGSVVVIDKSVNIQDAALFGCAVMTGVGAVINTARIRPGDSVAIIGLGGVGLNGIIGAKLGGAETIIAKIHVLIIPKSSYCSFIDFSENASPTEQANFYRSIQEIATKLSINNGYRLITNIGLDGGQEVPHFHFHLLSGRKN